MLRIAPKTLALVLAAVVGLGAFGFWLRDSSLVAVRDVTVTGISGSQAETIRAALTRAARDMTTLHVRTDELRRAAAPFDAVADVQAEADFPHGLTVRVRERVAVAAVAYGGRDVPVAEDGTLLRGSTAEGVPTLELRRPVGGDRLDDPSTLQTVQLLAAAPGPLRAKVANAFRGPRGLTVRLSDGPSVHFGSSERLGDKWRSLTAVLASGNAEGATAIDVRVPERPAAAGLEPLVIAPEPSTLG